MFLAASMIKLHVTSTYIHSAEPLATIDLINNWWRQNGPKNINSNQV